MPKWILAAFVIPALFGAAMIFAYRDVVFHWDFATPVGDFVFEKDAELLLRADDFLQAQNQGQTCVTDWLGRDEKFLYLYGLCGTFESPADGQVKMTNGWEKPLRVEWDLEARRIDSAASPEEGADAGRHYRQMFPKLAYAMARQNQDERSHKLLQQAYRKQQGLPPQ